MYIKVELKKPEQLVESRIQLNLTFPCGTKGALSTFSLPSRGAPKPKVLNPLTPSDALRKHRNFGLQDLFSSVLSQFKKYRPSVNLQFNNLGNFQSLKLRILAEKILLIFVNLLPPSDAARKQKNFI